MVFPCADCRTYELATSCDHELPPDLHKIRSIKPLLDDFTVVKTPDPEDQYAAEPPCFSKTPIAMSGHCVSCLPATWIHYYHSSTTNSTCSRSSSMARSSSTRDEWTMTRHDFCATDGSSEYTTSLPTARILCHISGRERRFVVANRGRLMAFPGILEEHKGHRFHTRASNTWPPLPMDQCRRVPRVSHIRMCAFVGVCHSDNPVNQGASYLIVTIVMSCIESKVIQG
jgi:hypothetical protein